jgi:ABC-type transport system involved in cytochrome bd biosynthesis fused ATPase/permease subunit
MVRSGRIDGVTLAVLALITLASFEPVNLLPAASAKIEVSMAAARRLFAIADRPQPVPEPTTPVDAGTFRELTINHLDFSYPGSDHPALRDISLTLTPGRKIALVGPSGSGKSTLIKAVQHHLPVPAGTIIWNGMDSLNLAGEDIRANQAVLSQNGYLFSASLGDNLKLANPDRSFFEGTLSQVGLEKWFSSLPEGLDTWIGENGSQLSGGERQRLLLARTLLLKRPVILADEPVSNLDLASEQDILRLVVQADSGTACLVATHRLTAMDLFDEILVLQDGRINQRGSHSELVASDGLYRDLWQQQNNLFAFDR